MGSDGTAVDAAAAQAGGRHAPGSDAHAARGGRGAVRSACPAHLQPQARILHLVAHGDTARQAGVPVSQVVVGPAGFSMRLVKEAADASACDAALVPLLAASHGLFEPGLAYDALGGRPAVRRAANPWDRFYRHHEAPWRGERSVEALRPYLGDGPVLELGCGNGKMLRPLRKAGVDAVGLDIAWHALRRLGLGVLADARWLPVADDAFTCVLDIHCTGHLDPAGRAVAWREAARVLTPGGHLVVERLGPDDLRAGQGQPVDGDAARVLEDGRTTAFETRDALEARLVRAGFEVVASHDARRTPVLSGRPITRHEVHLVARLP